MAQNRRTVTRNDKERVGRAEYTFKQLRADGTDISGVSTGLGEIVGTISPLP